MLKPKTRSDFFVKKAVIEASSKSIRKCSEDILDMVEGADPKVQSTLRTEFRENLSQALTELARLWYRKGFNRGHKESYRRFAETGEVPVTIKTQVRRSLLRSSQSKINLSSRLKKDFIKGIRNEFGS